MKKVKDFNKYTHAIVYYIDIYADDKTNITALTRIGHCLHMLETYGDEIKIKEGKQ